MVLSKRIKTTMDLGATGGDNEKARNMGNTFFHGAVRQLLHDVTAEKGG
jgi:hypothetical protein